MVVLMVDSGAIVLLGSSWLDSLACSLLLEARSLLRAFLLVFTKTIIMDVKTIMDMVKPIANTLAVAVVPVHVHLELNSVKFNNVLAVTVLNVRNLLQLPVIFPQTTVCMAKMHILPSSGRSVQVTLVWLVVVGQLPQFDVRML